MAALFLSPTHAGAWQGGFGAIDPPAPPPLPGAPLWEQLLLENPWPAAIVLGAGAVAAWVAMRHRADTRQTMLVVGALILGAAGVCIAASWVVTTREAVREQTFALVGSAARAEAIKVGDLLAPDAALFPPGGGSSLDRDAIVARVRDNLGGRWKLREWAILECEASVSGNTGRTQVKVRATPEAVGFPNISWWRLGWRRDESGVWRAISIEPVSVTGEVERELR